MSRRPKKNESVYEELDKITEGATSKGERWQERALCKGMDEIIANELFFNNDIKDPLKHARRALCHECPVRRQCLDYGNSISPQYGCWGGLNPGERRAHIRYSNSRQEIPDGAAELEMRLAQR